jgi:hypothetical protein
MLDLQTPRHTSTLRIPAGWSRRKGVIADHDDAGRSRRISAIPILIAA